MTIGIILAVLFLIVCLKFITKRCHLKNVDRVMLKIHRVLGVLLLISAVLHMVLVLPLIRQRPIGMYIAGGVMIICALAAGGSFCFRIKLKKKWILIHRGAALLFLLLLIFHVIVGVNSFSAYQKAISGIVVHDVETAGVADGKYIGECDAGYIYAKVEVIIKDGSIEDINLLEHRNEKGKNAESIPETIVKADTVKVDAVSGATNSSKVIMKAVENALTNEEDIK